MALNIITDNTGYVKFDFYDQNTGAIIDTIDIVKVNVTAISTFINTKKEGATGLVSITTNSVVDKDTKKGGFIQLIPSQWALSTAATTPIASASALRTALITYFSSKW